MHRRGAGYAPEQVLNSKRTEIEPPAGARAKASPLPGNPLQTEKGQWAERIVTAYPGNGARYVALQSVLEALKRGDDPADLLNRVQAHAAKFVALPAEEQRFCPRKDSYFRDERWHDNPNMPPWRNSGVSSPAGPKKKEGAPPDALEVRRLAAARALWPDLAEGTRWKDFSPGKQRQIDQTLTQQKHP